MIPLRLPAPVLGLALSLLFAAGCRTAADPALSAGLRGDARGTVENPELAALCAEAWEEEEAHDPVWASELGDQRFLGQLADTSLVGTERHLHTIQGFLERAERISPLRLSDEDRITLQLLYGRWTIEIAIAKTGVDYPSWNLEPRSGVHVDFLSLAPDQPIDTARQREQLVERWSAMPQAIERQMENLKRGLANGRVASHTACLKVIEQLDQILRTPVEESPLARPGSREGEPDRLAELDMDTKITVLRLVRNDIYPAFRGYRELLRGRSLPRARDDDHPGVSDVAGGTEAYKLAIRQYTSLDLSPKEIHEYGRSEVARIRQEMGALGEKAFGTSDLAAIQGRLRTDQDLYFQTEDEVLAEAGRRLARAQAAVPAVFGRLPRAKCEVVAIPAHEAPQQTIAYYRAPAADGSRPGRYYVNTYEPQTRPRFEAAVLAYHESVPGHHLQIAIASELEGLPLVRRYDASTAFVEGWALYVERLCDELGLYDSDLDRLGMLSFDAWRACRLVVDTGLHAYGWTRQQAIDYMTENTLLTPGNIENEVDRYIAWPGQALAYKIGQREILALRARAQEELGPAFSLAEFHDHVLEEGGVTLSVLRDRIDAWIRRTAANN
jgi:uncharacterized protein (DUF885 family)